MHTGHRYSWLSWCLVFSKKKKKSQMLFVISCVWIMYIFIRNLNPQCIIHSWIRVTKTSPLNSVILLNAESGFFVTLP